jgi:hypothetical protein
MTGRARTTARHEDGTATLARDDVMTVLTALRDAVRYRNDAGLPVMITRYAAVAFALGDD